MRIFLAVDIPSSVKQTVEKALLPIKKLYPQFNWVSAKNYHITVHFYGETDGRGLEKIKKNLEMLLHDENGFYLYSTHVGLFMRSKIIIHLNFRREKQFEQIVEKVSGKKNTPHLTLGRCRIPSKQQYLVLKKRLEKLAVDVEFSVKKMTLFESIMMGKTPSYKEHASYSLALG